MSLAKTILTLTVGILSVMPAMAQRPPTGPPRPPFGCMTPGDAKDVAQGWAQSISNFTDGLVDALVTEDFTEYTDSALSLNAECLMAPVPGPEQADAKLGTAIWKDRKTFKLLQGSSAPFQAEIQNVWNNCNTVFMRWKLTDTGSRPVNGIIVMETVPAPANNTYDGVDYKFQIKTSYYEFNNQAWVQNQLDDKVCKDPVTGKPKN